MVRAMADLARLVIAVDSRDVKRAQQALADLGIQSQRTEGAVDRMGASARTTGAAFGGLATFISTASAAAAAAKFVQVADQMTNLESRIRLTMSATQSYTQIQRELLAVANSSRVDINAVGLLYARIDDSLNKLGGTQRETIGIVNALSKALMISGATTAESTSAIIQFSQAMASGVLRGEEFNSISEAAPLILMKLEQSLGVTRGELRKMAEQGQLTSAVVGNALLGSVEEFEAMAARMPVTVSGSMQILRNQMALVVEDFNKGTGATAGLSSAVTTAAQSVGELVQAFREGNLTEQQQIMIGIGGAVGGAAAAMTTLVAALGAARIAMLAFNVATKANPLIMGATLVATGAAAIVGYGMATSQATSKTQELTNAERTLQELREQRQRTGRANLILDQRIASEERKVAQLRAQVAAENPRQIADEQAKSAAVNQTASGYARLTQATNNQAAATDRVTAAERARQEAAKARQSAAVEIADLTRITELARGTLTIEEARARVALERQGYNAAEIAAIEAQRGALQSLADQRRIADEQAAEDARAVTDEIQRQQQTAQQTVDAFLSADVGANLAAGFDQASQSIGAFVNAFQAVLDQQDKYREAIIAAGNDSAKVAKINQAQARAQVKQFGDIAGAAKGFFKEGSSGYRTLQNAEKAFRAVQIAQAIEAFAVKSGLLKQETLLTLAEEAKKQVAGGVTAAIDAMKGLPFPANLAAMGATIAAIGALGVAIGGGGGGSSAAPVSNTGTGTVFGDPTAQSESIANSIEALEGAASLENRISSAMLSSLRNIEANISGLAGLVVRGNPGGALAAGVNTGTRVNFGLPDGFFGAMGIGGALNKVIGSIFGSTRRTITGQGLFAGAQGLQDILGGGLNLQEFVDVETRRKSLFRSRTSTSTQFSQADDLLSSQFTQVIRDFTQSLNLAAQPLGVATNDITARLQSFVVDIGRIDLKDLNGQQIQERLTAVFGQVGDNIAAAALPGLNRFQRVGEGYFETVVRVASGIEQADTLLQRLGVSAVNYAGILSVQGDVTTEIIRQSVLLTDASRGVAGGFAEIVGNFQGTGEEITDLVQQLREMQDALRATGQNALNLTTFMIAGAGGADRLSAGLERFFDDLLTPAEQVSEKMRRLMVEFGRANVVLPQSEAEFRDLVRGIDTSTEAGQRLFGSVIALTPAFLDARDAVADLTQSIENDIRTALREIQQAVTDAENDLRQAFQRESGALRDLIRGFDTSAERLREFARSLNGIVDTPTQSLGRLRAEFDSLIRRARLGDQDAAAQIPNIGGALRDAVVGNAATAQDAARELARIQAAANDAATVQERQKSIAEQQLDKLTLAVAKLIDIEVGQLTVATIRTALTDLQVSAPQIDALIAATDINSDGIIDALEAGRVATLASQSDTVASLRDAVLTAGGMTNDAVRQSLAGKATDAQISALIRAVDTNADGQITTAEASAAALVAENQEVQQAVNVVGQNTRSVQSATDALTNIQSTQNQVVASLIAQGFGGLIERNSQAIAGIDRVREASDRIANLTAQLVGVTQSTAAAAEAERQRQQELERERVRQSELAAAQQAGLAAVTTAQQARSGIETSLAVMRDNMSRSTTEARSFNGGLATFTRGPNGEIFSDFSHLHDFRKPQFNSIHATELAPEAALGVSRADALRGGLNSQLISALEAAQIQRQRIIDLGGIPTFATGGMHSGGWRVVGENGPELEYTGPSRIYNAGQTSSMLDNSDQVAEMRMMRDEMKSYLWSIAKATTRSADRLDRWDGDGLPEERVA